jgi:hypothetical protein
MLEGRGQKSAQAHTLSGALGAKQLVVVMTQATASGRTRASCPRTASTSVTSWSPSCFISTTMGIRFAATIALRQVFWSTRLQMAYLQRAVGLKSRIVVLRAQVHLSMLAALHAALPGSGCGYWQHAGGQHGPCRTHLLCDCKLRIALGVTSWKARAGLQTRAA